MVAAVGLAKTACVEVELVHNNNKLTDRGIVIKTTAINIVL